MGKTQDRLPGGDTRCVVTILDEDFPGTIEFTKTEIEVSKNAKYVDVDIQRIDGSDGTIHCQIITEQLADSAGAAQPFEHFMPMQSIITFPHAETSKVVRVELAKPDPIADDKAEATKKADSDEGEEKNDSEAEEEEEEQDLVFTIKLSDPKPEGAKISRNNVCIVTISHSEDFEAQQEVQQKLLELYLANKQPNWGKQFVDACMLGP